jgi:hypothetical protein
MQTRSRYRMHALAGITSGVATLAAVGLGQLLEGAFALLLVTLVLLLVALPGLHGVQQGRNGWLGRLGYVVALVGGAVLTVLFAVFVVAEFILDRGEAFEDAAGVDVAAAIGFFGLVLGLVAFGIAALKPAILSRWATLLFLLGLPLGVGIDMATGAFFDEGITEWGFFIGVPLFALGLIAMSWSMLSTTAAPTEGGTGGPAGEPADGRTPSGTSQDA